jgi:hypothetical protein
MFQRVVARADFGASGSLLLAVSGDVGVSSGGDSVTGSASTGGTLPTSAAASSLRSGSRMVKIFEVAETMG